MTYWIGGFFGALVFTFGHGRLFMWMLKWLGDSPARPILAFGLPGTLLIVGFGFLNGGGAWNPLPTGPVYLVAAGIWIGLELLGQKGRAAAADTPSADRDS